MKNVERAAVLLLMLGEQTASKVLKFLGPREVQKIGEHITKLGTISPEHVTEVVNAFHKATGSQTKFGVGADEFMRKVLVDAVGEEKAAGLIERIMMGGSTQGLETLKWMDPRAIFELIRLEHPQIISILLAYLDPDQAAQILTMFPARDRSDMILRMATLESIQPTALQELNGIMERHFAGNANMQTSAIGGIKSAANILNFVETSAESEIIDAIKDADPELAEKIEDLMFVFENLGELDDRSMQALLREVSTDSLILALKGADERIKEKVFSNMSKRAAEMLRDDLETRGPVRLSEVELAQKEILSIARRMAESGEIILGSSSEQFV
ncbi:MAG: flagellar motor switch protein FliG [Gammaproteobacteria bacterium RBG_16_57_12]|nr:MAG: flagellar motor switch protein FliG [Gammaproteobacteria bacterium RBG_16_57_12]